MRNIGFVLFAFLMLGSKSDHTIPGDPEKGLLPNKNMLHIGIVVSDIDQAIGHWSNLLGLEEGPNVVVAEGHPDNPTQYRGHPTHAKAKLAFMDLENIQIELIEPIGDEQSHWREFLESKGEGVHHIAFEVEGLGERYVEMFEKNGIPLAQHGGWDTGEYGYMDGAKTLGVMVELLEFYRE